jgi:hypothetical protein
MYIWILYYNYEYSIDMYASDLTHKKRAATVFRNLQLQKEWFATGQTIRILGQKGGNDYAYMTHLEEGCVADTCWQLYVPIRNKFGNGPVSGSTSGMVRIFTGAVDTLGNNISVDMNNQTIYDSGYGSQVPYAGILDDSFITIPMGGMDFFFNSVNYGVSNGIAWNSNNMLVFGPQFDPNLVSLNKNVANAIMMGNYDRLCSNIHYENIRLSEGSFNITRFIVSFSNYYTDTTDFYAGKLQVRLIKENTGNMRQWVEVGVISAPSSPGYSNNTNVNYPSGVDTSGNRVDSNGDIIDQTKNSPWDISNGTKFLQVAGNQYSTAFPVAGTTILYESDKTGTNWTFSPNMYVPI